MAERKAAGKGTKSRGSKTLTAEEKAALRETVQERKAEARGANDEKALLAKIAEMPPADRALAKRIHEIVKTSAPSLSPKTWYGMPAYAKDDKVLCFFTPASKFKERYSTFGFNGTAALDEGEMWPTSFALKKLTPADEAKLAALVKRAVR